VTYLKANARRIKGGKGELALLEVTDAGFKEEKGQTTPNTVYGRKQERREK
jgi:hypothetical protein